MRRAARVDANQREIVAALTRIGCSVFSTAGVADGFPDLVVGRANKTLLLEVKNGDKSPSRQRLRVSQEKFRDWWRGHYAVVSTPEEAIDVVSEAIGK